MSSLRRFVAASVILSSFALANYVAAQSSGEQALRETIRAAILSDARSQGMTPAEVDAMVEALTRQAQSVGMTAEDIVWRPTTDAAGEPAQACDGILCALNKAFGFDGSDYTIPIWLGACSLMLIFLIAGILEYHHIHKKRLVREQQSVQ